MAIFAGIDAGSYSVKVVLLAQSEILARVTLPAGLKRVAEAAEGALNNAVAEAGISKADIRHTIATGIGRPYVSFADGVALEVMCLARGVNYSRDSIRTVLDVGAEHCLALQCLNGQAITVARTDACAAGAGIFLQVVARLLEVPIEEMGQMSLQSKQVAEIVSRCAVFAETEIISLVHAGMRAEAILKGVYRGLALRLYPLLVQVGLKRDVAMVGGGAKDIGLIAAMEEQVGMPIFVPPYPSTVAALGAALIAGDRAQA